MAASIKSKIASFMKKGDLLKPTTTSNTTFEYKNTFTIFKANQIEEKELCCKESLIIPITNSRAKQKSANTTKTAKGKVNSKLSGLAVNQTNDDKKVIYFPQLEEKENQVKDNKKVAKGGKKKVLKKRRKKRTDSAAVVKYFEGSDGRQSDESNKGSFAKYFVPFFFCIFILLLS